MSREIPCCESPVLGKQNIYSIFIENRVYLVQLPWKQNDILDLLPIHIVLCMRGLTSLCEEPPTTYFPFFTKADIHKKKIYIQSCLFIMLSLHESAPPFSSLNSLNPCLRLPVTLRVLLFVNWKMAA